MLDESGTWGVCGILVRYMYVWGIYICCVYVGGICLRDLIWGELGVWLWCRGRGGDGVLGVCGMYRGLDVYCTYDFWEGGRGWREGGRGREGEGGVVIFM